MKRATTLGVELKYSVQRRNLDNNLQFHLRSIYGALLRTKGFLVSPLHHPADLLIEKARFRPGSESASRYHSSTGLELLDFALVGTRASHPEY